MQEMSSQSLFSESGPRDTFHGQSRHVILFHFPYLLLSWPPLAHVGTGAAYVSMILQVAKKDLAPAGDEEQTALCHRIYHLTLDLPSASLLLEEEGWAIAAGGSGPSSSLQCVMCWIPGGIHATQTHILTLA